MLTRLPARPFECVHARLNLLPPEIEIGPFQEPLRKRANRGGWQTLSCSPWFCKEPTGQPAWCPMHPLSSDSGVAATLHSVSGPRHTLHMCRVIGAEARLKDFVCQYQVHRTMSLLEPLFRPRDAWKNAFQCSFAHASSTDASHLRPWHESSHSTEHWSFGLRAGRARTPIFDVHSKQAMQ